MTYRAEEHHWLEFRAILSAHWKKIARGCCNSNWAEIAPMGCFEEKLLQIRIPVIRPKIFSSTSFSRTIFGNKKLTRTRSTHLKNAKFFISTTSRLGHQWRKKGSFWAPSVPNECEYLTITGTRIRSERKVPRMNLPSFNGDPGRDLNRILLKPLSWRHLSTAIATQTIKH
ncbi:hypothetical protein TNCV_1263061 [Trichonephila clavipes]|nr:hypothetical protein TNCV_1263061 [Trichonephila clavipes]